MTAIDTAGVGAPTPPDLFADKFTRDPVPALRALATIDPMWWWDNEITPTWVASNHELVSAVMKSGEEISPSLYYSKGYMASGSEDLFSRVLSSCLFGVPRADHTRLRKLVSRSFTNRKVEIHRPFIERTVAELFDAAQVAADASDDGIIDWRNMVAAPLPPRVIAEVCGVSMDDMDTFVQNALTFNYVVSSQTTMEQWDEVFHAVEAVCAAVDRSIAVARAHIEATGEAPNNVIGNLTQALIEDDITLDEIRGMVMILVIAGAGTVGDQISHGLAVALGDAEEMAKLVADPEGRMKLVADEMLRMSHPSKMLTHYAVHDQFFGGKEVHAGDSINICIGAANRDPAVFEDPDRFWPDRPDASEAISFGLGDYFCIGSALAKIEATTVVSMLAKRWPNIELAGPLEFDTSHVVLRPVSKMPVRLNGSRS